MKSTVESSGTLDRWLKQGSRSGIVELPDGGGSASTSARVRSADTEVMALPGLETFEAAAGRGTFEAAVPVPPVPFSIGDDEEIALAARADDEFDEVGAEKLRALKKPRRVLKKHPTDDAIPVSYPLEDVDDLIEVNETASGVESMDEDYEKEEEEEVEDAESGSQIDPSECASGQKPAATRMSLRKLPKPLRSTAVRKRPAAKDDVAAAASKAKAVKARATAVTKAVKRAVKKSERQKSKQPEATAATAKGKGSKVCRAKAIAKPSAAQLSQTAIKRRRLAQRLAMKPDGDDDLLPTILKIMIAKLSKEHREKLRERLQEAADSMEHRSGCSGTESSYVTLYTLCELMGVKVMKHTASAEYDDRKRDWCKEVLEILGDTESLLAKDMNDMQHNSVFCHRRFRKVNNVLTSRKILLDCGFSCKDLSKLKFHRDANGDILITGAGTTGYTFLALIRWVARERPLVLILENVEELADETQLNIHELKRSFAELGFAIEVRVFDCSRFGLPQRRKRAIVLGLHYFTLGVTLQEGAALLAKMLDTTASLELVPLPLDQCLLSPDDPFCLAELERRERTVSDEDKVIDINWPTTHNIFMEHLGLRWGNFSWPAEVVDSPWVRILPKRETEIVKIEARPA